MRRKIVAGNWKMNGDVAFVSDYLNDFLKAYSSAKGVLNEQLEVLLAPPSILLHHMSERLAGSGVELSAQNASEFESGAYTGEVSSAMLKDAGCKWCLVGHSERRALFGDTDAIVLSKIKRLLSTGIQPILCVGETLEERESGQAEEVVASQVNAVFAALSEAELQRIVIAYEPVWAIGTGKTASPVQAQTMHALIRSLVARVSGDLAAGQVVLYGGSVNAANAAELFAQPDIDGGLVGGASLKPADFLEICQSA